MAIDSVGGGGSSDPSYETRRKMLDIERAAELDRIESKKKRDIADAEEAKNRALERIYTDQEDIIETRQKNADDKIARAKEAVDTKIKAFETDAARMTDEARRQFTAKAHQLAHNADEFDKQRQFMLKSHDETVRRLKDEREQAIYNETKKLEHESQIRRAEHQSHVLDEQSRAQQELDQIRTQGRNAKLQETGKRDQEIRTLQHERDQNRNQILSEIDFNKRTGEGQLDRAKAQLETAEQVQLERFQDEMAQTTRENRSSVNKAHNEGKRKVMETHDHYNYELEDLRKDAKHNKLDLETRSAKNLATIENDAKSQEYIAKRNYAYRQDLLEKSRDQMINESLGKNKELHEKLEKDYHTQYKTMTDVRKKELDRTQAQLQSELHVQRNLGKKQISDQIAKNAATLSQHQNKVADEFYKLHHMGAKITESPEEYIVQILVPEHEQDTVRATLQGGKITVSGTRRSESSTVLEDGHKVATNSYQSYSEAFPIQGKPEMKRMSRTYENGILTFRIPRF